MFFNNSISFNTWPLVEKTANGASCPQQKKALQGNGSGESVPLLSMIMMMLNQSF